MPSNIKTLFLSIIVTVLTITIVVALQQIKNLSGSENIISLKGFNLPKLAGSSKPVPDFARFTNVTEKKQAFFNYLLPEIQRQNSIVLQERQMVMALSSIVNENKELDSHQKKVLEKLTIKYQLNGDKALPVRQTLDVLIKRVDVIPEALILVQAANESGWGTSRFARLGYNFFGLWCFKEGCGFVPKQRNEGAIHEVAKFKDLSHAVMTYVRNLNRHNAYQQLRDIRAELRQNNQPITAKALVHGLSRYSERGQDYIDELLSMLRVNRQYMAISP